MTRRQVTVWGGSGFVGRHLARQLREAGFGVRAVSRHRPAGELVPGVEYVMGDLLDPGRVGSVIRDAFAVINLVGAMSLPNDRAYHALHERGPGILGRSARDAGVERLVQISALGVAPDAPSVADRSKAAGEEAIRRAYPEVTIARPSLLFGEGDHFFSRLVSLAEGPGLIPLIGGGRTRVQPAHVADLTLGLVRMLQSPEAVGAAYEVGGPEVYTLRELAGLVFTALGKPRRVLALPYVLASPLGMTLGLLPNPPLNYAQVQLLKTDKVVTPGALTLQSLGVQPRGLEGWLAAYLGPGGRSTR
jgi:NADH dehydrogenase